MVPLRVGPLLALFLAAFRASSVDLTRLWKHTNFASALVPASILLAALPTSTVASRHVPPVDEYDISLLQVSLEAAATTVAPSTGSASAAVPSTGSAAPAESSLNHTKKALALNKSNSTNSTPPFDSTEYTQSVHEDMVKERISAVNASTGPAPAPYSEPVTTEPPTLQPLPEGTRTPEEIDTIKATRQQATLNCEVCNWSEWGDCTHGPDGVRSWMQTRSRDITQPQLPGGTQCPSLSEAKICNPDGNLHYANPF